MKGRPSTDTIPVHPFAWDGMAFDVPEAWNLSFYHFGRKQAELRMEDDDRVRLEMEWLQGRGVDAETAVTTYRARTSAFEEEAGRMEILDGLAAGWLGFLYDMPEGKSLVTLLRLGTDDGRAAFLRLHFRRNERDLRKAVVRQLTGSFRLHTQGRIPWRVYDMAVDVDSSFHLIQTAFNAGRKMLVFQRKLTRLYVWHFSLADLLLRKRRVGDWAAEFLNGFKSFRAVRFVTAPNGSVGTVRKWRHLAGHYDEIGRGCFRYAVGFKVLDACNAIVLWAYSFRTQRDLDTVGELVTAA